MVIQFQRKADISQVTKPGFKPLKITQSDDIRAYITILNDSHYAGIMSTHEKWFHDSEWLYVRGLNVEKRRKEFVLGRCSGKLAVSAYLAESDLARLLIEPGAFGQPVLRYHTDDYPELSISHTDNVALAAVSQHGYPIGIDIEKLTDRDISFLAAHITQNDLNLLADLTIDTQHAYLQAWTIKEALSKILRCGITVPFELLELESVSAIDANVFCCEYKNFPQYRCYSWFLGDYLISVTIPRSIRFKVDTKLFSVQLEL